jgi:hypothetical protein
MDPNHHSGPSQFSRKLSFKSRKFAPIDTIWAILKGHSILGVSYIALRDESDLLLRSSSCLKNNMMRELDITTIVRLKLTPGTLTLIQHYHRCLKTPAMEIHYP